MIRQNMAEMIESVGDEEIKNSLEKFLIQLEEYNSIVFLIDRKGEVDI